MNIKSNDIPYLGCNKDKIINSNPVFDAESVMYYFKYVIERLRIQQRRASGQEFPWTDNEILRDNSFTNNRRQDDRTTKWLLDNISNNPELSFEDRVWRTIIFRLYNKIETAELISLDSSDFWNHIDIFAYILDKQTNDVFTRAYKTVSTKYQYKDKYSSSHNWRSWCLLGTRDLFNSYMGKVPEELLKTAQEGFSWLKTIPGVGDFLALQLLIDLMYIDEIPYSNNCFVICGPGAKTGLDRLFYDRDGMSYEECIYFIRDNYDDLYDLSKYLYPGELEDIKLTEVIHEFHNDSNAYCVTDIQNTFCEYSKYRYLMEGKHKNPRKYVYNK